MSARRRAMGLVQRDTFVPQSDGLGQEAQVDWYEAWADFGGERTRLQVFARRPVASSAAFHRACRPATQQAFLEAHEGVFAYSAGCSGCCFRPTTLARPMTTSCD